MVIAPHNVLKGVVVWDMWATGSALFMVMITRMSYGFRNRSDTLETSRVSPCVHSVGVRDSVERVGK